MSREAGCLSMRKTGRTITTRDMPHTARRNRRRVHAPQPSQGCLSVKRTTTGASTTATPQVRWITTGRALTLGGLGLSSSATAVTLPAAAHLLGHRSPALAVIVGIAPALPAVLAVTAVVATYLVASTVAILTTVGRVIRGNSPAATCLDDLFGWLTNAPISLLTVTPLKPPTRRAQRGPHTPAVSPLPAAPIAARKEDERLYWETIQRQAAARPRGARDDVALPGDPITQPMPRVQGRHARAGTTEPSPTATEVRLPEMIGKA